MKGHCTLLWSRLSTLSWVFWGGDTAENVYCSFFASHPSTRSGVGRDDHWLIVWRFCRPSRAFLSDTFLISKFNLNSFTLKIDTEENYQFKRLIFVVVFKNKVQITNRLIVIKIINRHKIIICMIAFPVLLLNPLQNWWMWRYHCT